ncbi:10445_t:CDS:1, partial [Scutellospora calospora]
WIEEYCQICRYSLDVKKCYNQKCCKPSWVPKVTVLLQENNGFLPPVIQGCDQHFLNPIHILEYYDKLKISPYDKHCPSISTEMHQYLSCSECKKYFSILKFIQKHKLQSSNCGNQSSITDFFKNTLSNSAIYEDFV